MSIKGVDISNNNGSVNIQNLKNAGYKFIIAKATEGLNFVDKYYVSNINTTKSLGLVSGAYHFARFNDTNTAIAEAEHFKSVVRQAIPTFVVLDIEHPNAVGNLTAATDAFMNSIAQLGLPILFYSYPYFIKDHFNTSVGKYNLWIAQYSGSSPDIWCWNKYAIWQYSENENGLDANVMTDEFYSYLTSSTGTLQSQNAPKKEVIKVDNIVAYGNSIDKRAAEYLADYLKCSTIDANLPYDYSNIKNVFCIGGEPSNKWTSYATVKIAGKDRYDTMIQVLKYIKVL